MKIAGEFTQISGQLIGSGLFRMESTGELFFEKIYFIGMKSRKQTNIEIVWHLGTMVAVNAIEGNGVLADIPNRLFSQAKASRQGKPIQFPCLVQAMFFDGFCDSIHTNILLGRAEFKNGFPVVGDLTCHDKVRVVGNKFPVA